jgi:hypothetical protein
LIELPDEWNMAHKATSEYHSNSGSMDEIYDVSICYLDRIAVELIPNGTIPPEYDVSTSRRTITLDER